MKLIGRNKKGGERERQTDRSREGEEAGRRQDLYLYFSVFLVIIFAGRSQPVSTDQVFIQYPL